MDVKIFLQPERPAVCGQGQPALRLYVQRFYRFAYSFAAFITGIMGRNNKNTRAAPHGLLLDLGAGPGRKVLCSPKIFAPSRQFGCPPLVYFDREILTHTPVFCNREDGASLLSFVLMAKSVSASPKDTATHLMGLNAGSFYALKCTEKYYIVNKIEWTVDFFIIIWYSVFIIE